MELASSNFARNSSFLVTDKLGRIGVLLGGPSSEREISLKSGRAVFNALSEAGFDVVAINITTDDSEANKELISLAQIDCAFVALHGYFGEDGGIQGVLDDLKIPYTGSGRTASRLAMDKIVSHLLFDTNGLFVPAYRFVDKDTFSKGWKMDDDLSFPLVVKPAGNGSSIGLSIVDTREELGLAMDFAFSYDNNIIIEEHISGREMTVGILGDSALPVIEIAPKKRFFDYEAKYQKGLTDYILPAILDKKIAKKVQDTALSAHKLLGCYGYSRVDIILDTDFTPFILEVNSIPGFTETSLLPKAAKLTGLSFTQLCIKLIESAYEKTAKTAALSR